MKRCQVQRHFHAARAYQATSTRDCASLTVSRDHHQFRARNDVLEQFCDSTRDMGRRRRFTDRHRQQEDSHLGHQQGRTSRLVEHSDLSNPSAHRKQLAGYGIRGQERMMLSQHSWLNSTWILRFTVRRTLTLLEPSRPIGEATQRYCR